MDLIQLVLIAVILILLLVIALLALGRRKSLSSSDLERLRAEVHDAAEESLEKTQRSLDRDMARLETILNQSGRKLEEGVSRISSDQAKHMQNVLLSLSDESRRQAQHHQGVLDALNVNFGRILSENREDGKAKATQMEKLTASVAEGMETIRRSNEEKLKEIQNVVDQKLQETLDKRIAESFRQVGENLEKLYESMGSLNVLKNDVEKMNSLFSNVKTRGVWGEMQAEYILSDILSEDQWVKNYSPKGNREVVEFAIRMPGKNSDVYLPIDSKFPVADYERYKAKVDEGDGDVTQELKAIRDRIVSEAKDIRKKYIVPPETTDFAILFVPSESLFLELLKMDGLMEKLQNECRVVVTGPNNFASLLNSLRLGFKTMQIEKYTSTIWHLFENMKDLFEDLSRSIDDTRRHVDKAGEAIDTAKRKREKLGNILDKIESSAEKVSLEDHPKPAELAEVPKNFES